MTTRTNERLWALGCILNDGLNYEWFRVQDLDSDACTATLLVDTGNVNEETGRAIWKRVEVTPDLVARGLRMYREWLEGKRETYPDQWARGHGRPEGERARADYYGWKTVKFDETNGAEGDYDANTADSVMQFATLGYNIFS